jgi:uncharacterized protein
VTRYALERVAAAGKEVTFDLTTNATLLDERTIAFLVEHDVRVTVSFDGPRAVQDRQRPFKGGRGSYDATLPRIRALLRAAPGSGCRATLSGASDPSAIARSLGEAGFRRIALAPASPPLNAASAGPLPPRATVAGLAAKAEREAGEWARAIAARDAAALLALRDSSVFATTLQLLVNRERRFPACGAGRRLAAVSANGGVYLCHRFVGDERFRLGSVDAPKLARDAFLRSPFARVPRCLHCIAKYVCAGGCPYDSLAMNGSADEPSADVCALMRRSVELAAGIDAGLDDADRDYLHAEGVLEQKQCPLDLF